MSGHLLAFEHATRRLTLADRARGAMRQRVTVGGATTAKIPALLHAGKAFALRDAGDVNSLHAVELTHLDLGTVLQILAFAIGETDFPETTAGGNACLLVMPGQRLVDAARLLLANRYLYRAVAVGFHRLHL